jgi:large subunit ribosomal protein L17
MKHKKAGRKFGRIKSQREAMLANLIGSLVIREKITTTEAKAKEVKSKIDRVINKAKSSSESAEKKVAVIRDLRRDLSKEAVEKLVGDFSKKFDGRNSGYTRVIKLPQRKSDASKMAVIEFV